MTENTEPNPNDSPRLMRESDKWLQRLALWGTILGFVVGHMTGWAGGVISTALLFRDHEKRIVILEKWHVASDQWDYDIALDVEHLQTWLHTRRPRSVPKGPAEAP